MVTTSKADEGGRGTTPTCTLKLERPTQFFGYLDLTGSPHGLFIADPSPPPTGTMVKVDAITGRAGVRLFSGTGKVTRSTAGDDAAGPHGVWLHLASLAPGVDEEVRRALLPFMAPAPPDPGPGPDDVVVGIDLGTTNSCVAVVENGQPRVLASRLGYNTIPSIVSFDEKGIPMVGQGAQRRMLTDPMRTAYGTKRYIGRGFSRALVSQFSKRMVYEILGDSEGLAAARVDGRVLSPIEVGACILAEMRHVSEESLGKPVRYACVTVPAYFTERQRAAVRIAGERAGLNVLRIVNEPTAAALRYGFKRDEQKTVLVYDLGGGTFDVSILEISGSLFMVQATAGDTFLGGLDFDRAVVDHLVSVVKQQRPAAVIDRSTMERLMAAAREAKEGLSAAKTHTVDLPNLRHGPAPTDVLNVKVTLTRDKLEALVKPALSRTIDICNQAMAAAKLKVTDIGEVLLVGGQTRMPMVQDIITRHFGRAPSRRVNPDEVVALGAALVAGVREQASAPTLIDVLPVPIWLRGRDGTLRQVFKQNEALPADTTVNEEGPAGEPLKLSIYQGETGDADECEFLGALTVSDAGAPDKITRAEVTLKLSSECLLTVFAKITRTGETREVRLATQQASAQAVSKLGGERLKTDGAIPVVTEEEPPAAEGPGAWARFSAWLGGLFRRK